MQPYCKNKQIWVCPSDSTVGRNLTNPATQNSYWLNAYVFLWSGLAANSPPSVTLAEIRYPATTIVFCDGPANDGQHVWPGPPTDWANTPDNKKQQERHSGGIVFSFADGHSRWYRVESLKSTILPDDSNTDTVPRLLSLPASARKPSNDGQNPWWRL
jgi:prepilin-type processing-associated H-X9-DG protein